MKRLFTHLMLLTALMLCSASSWAQLKICGHSVDLSATSTQTITGSGISGTVTYNAPSKQLTLENATLTSSGNDDGIYNQSVDGLSILFKGTVTINVNSTGNNVAALYTDKNLTLTSPGAAAPPVITLRNTGAGPAFKVRGATVTAWGDNITATAANNHAVVGEVYNSGTKPSLIFHFSRLSATGASDFKAVTGFTGGLSLYIAVHSGGTSFDSASGAIVNSSNSAVQEAVILPALTLGKLYIGAAGERSINTSSTGASTASGKFEYSSSAKKLTLTDLNVNGAGFVSRIPGLKIDFKGGGTLINSGIAMDLYGDTELTSDGTVELTSSSASAIYFNGNYHLTVCMPELVVTSSGGGGCGIKASDFPSSKLTLKEYNSQSVYKFLGTTANLRVGSIELNGMEVWTPDTYYNPADRTMYHHGVEAKGTDQGNDATWFRSLNYSGFTFYDLYVAGTRVSNRNSSSIVNPSIKSGKVTYDNSSKTLTFDGVKMEVASADDQGVRSYIPDLNIVLKGTNEMTTNATLFSLSKATTFSGSGNLEATSKEKHGISTAAGTNVTIATTNYIIVNAKGYGYWGGGGTGEKLTLKKTASDDFGYAFDGTEGTLINVPELVLDGMAFSNSAWPGLYGCYFDGKEIKQNGGNRAKGYVAFKSIKERTGIYVAGQEIVRCNDASYPIYVGSPYIKSGTQSVAYAPQTKTLTLDNATIDYQGTETNSYDIRLEPNVTVNLVVNGTNTLTGNEKMFAPLWGRDGSKITASGSGTLNLLEGPLYLWGGTFEAGDNLTVNCPHSFIGSNGDIAGHLTVGGNAVVKAKSIEKISSLILNDGQAITAPAGAVYNDNAVRVGTAVAQNVVISKAEIYDLKINGMAVNSANASDVLGDGKVVFVPTANTLTLDGATLSSIENRIKDLKVIVKGTTTVEDNANYVTLIDSYENITFEGDGKLILKSTGESSRGLRLAATYTDSQHNTLSMTLQGPAIEINTVTGITASGSYPILNIYYPTTVVYTGTGSPINMFGGFNLSKLAFMEPEGASYNSTSRTVELDGATYNGPLVIDLERYDLYVAGVQVTEDNKDDILGNGIFSYVTWYKKLSVKGDYTHTGASNIVSSSIDGLTIEVTGNSKLTSTTNATILRFRAPGTITGGKLTLETTSTDGGSIAIYNSDGDLTIRNAEIEIVGDGFSYAITGEPTYNLIIENSDIVATASVYGAIVDWGNITLTNCYIDSPRPAVINDGAVCDGAGNIIGKDATGTVVIKHGADAINGIDAAEAAEADVYDVAGRRLDQTRRGINIVRTKDGKTVKVLRK